MKLIKLTQSLFAQVDDEDFDKINDLKWYAVKAPRTYYVRSKSQGQKSLVLHRFIMNPPDNMLVDHIDGNGLNNQKENLRIVNHTSNMRNRKSHQNSSSQFLGVSYVKPWKAQIRANGKDIYLGRYTTEEEAAKAYDEAARTHYGEFANLNFKN
jgi:hypothetical protein